MPPQPAVTGLVVWGARRFWEATTGICYRTLQFAESQACRLGISALNFSALRSDAPHLHVLRTRALYTVAYLSTRHPMLRLASGA